MPKIIVYHGYYGCETGCCGHTVQFEDGSKSEWMFSHPYGEDPFEWAKEIVRDTFGEEHVKDLDWDNCIISDD